MPPLPFGFEVESADGKARAGRLRLRGIEIETPVFMPVGTLATVKGLTAQQLRETGARMLLCNAYHLSQRPGDAVVAKLGGLHAFMGWDGAILTDSGGYQVFSLATLRQVSDGGVSFRSHFDGSEIFLTPEAAIRIQEGLGSDVAMVLDECAPYPCPRGDAEAALRRTHMWAERCLAARSREGQALFCIAQGAFEPDLRRRSGEYLSGLPFDGFAVGGLSVGEPAPLRNRMLESVVPFLPENRPRYLMGLGKPADILAAVRRGIDMFDCVLPTRNGRNGWAFTRQGVLRMRNAAHRESDAPMERDCGCYACRTASRAYIRHLLSAEEMLGGVLLSLHNTAFYQRLMRAMRETILNGCLGDFERDWPCAKAGAEG
ncbi:MAG TPA: tRNA guanosine(34) transglycosylase Tgt [Candidatus Brocadiia bacterium]|nr:tRNA guanosine(34) transglycosylase Tgt [Candidatus Brocadiia bacterium]